MKRSMFRLLAICLSLFLVAILANSALAQGNGNGGGKGGGGGEDPLPPAPLNYALEYAVLPAGITDIYLRDVVVIDGQVLVAGRFQLNDEYHGFVYNSHTGELFDLFNLIGADCSCKAMSDSGLIVGNARDNNGDIRVFWLDYLADSPQVQYLDEQFAEVASMSGQQARDVNNFGDILIGSSNALTSKFIVNPLSGSAMELNLANPYRINDALDVISKEDVSGTYRAGRWSLAGGLELFSNIDLGGDYGPVNQLGEFGGVLHPSVNEWRPCRVGANIDWISEITDGIKVSTINDSGDLGFLVIVTTGKGRNRKQFSKLAFYHDALDRTFFIDELVEDPFLNAVSQYEIFITERVGNLSEPTPVITGWLEDDATGEHRIFFLFPSE